MIKLAEKDWEWDNILRKGEILLINGYSHVGYELNTTFLSSQTALALSIGRDILLFKNSSPKKVLFINTYLDQKDLLSITSAQIGGESHFSDYSDNFMMINIKPNMVKEKSSQLKQMIDDINPDIIVWDNINRLVNEDIRLSNVLLAIKEISGLKTKIISNYFLAPEKQYELFTLEQESSAFLSLSHNSTNDKYTLKLERKNGDLHSVSDCYINEKRNSFYNNRVRLYNTSDESNYISQDNGITPPLPL